MGINLPNGNEVEEIILPNGANAREVIGPNGERVFGGPAIPDDAVLYIPVKDEESEIVSDEVGDNDGDVQGSAQIVSSASDGGGAVDMGTDAENNRVVLNVPDVIRWEKDFSVGITSEGTPEPSGNGENILAVNTTDIGFADWMSFAIGYTDTNSLNATMVYDDGNRTEINDSHSLPSTPFDGRIFVQWDSESEDLELYLNADSDGTSPTNSPYATETIDEMQVGNGVDRERVWNDGKWSELAIYQGIKNESEDYDFSSISG